MEKLRLIPTPQDAMLGNSAGEEIPKKGDLHLHAVTMLRNMIITGALAPGERLNERELCASLNASRTPVREAIKTLAQDGLIKSLTCCLSLGCPANSRPDCCGCFD